MYPQSMFLAKNKEKKKKGKISNFSAAKFLILKLKSICLLHGQGFVMSGFLLQRWHFHIQLPNTGGKIWEHNRG